MRDLNPAAASIEMTWMAIPKGVATRTDGGTARQVLLLTVLPIFKQSTFSARGPFGSSPHCDNWAAFVKQELASFTVRVQPRGGRDAIPLDVALPQRARDAISRTLWDKFFEHTTPAARHGGQKTMGAASTKLVLREQSSAFARAAQEITSHVMSAQLLHLVDKAEAQKLNAAPAGMASFSIDQLFPSAGRRTAIKGVKAQWREDLQNGYGELADIYLPPKPSLAARLGDDTKLVKALSGWSGAEAEYLGVLIASCRPPAPPSIEAAGKPKVPVLSSRATMSIIEDLHALQVPEPDLHANPLVAAARKEGFAHRWSKLATRHMVTAVPYTADPTVSLRATADHHESEQNRLAMLMAEPGILSAIGMLFDLEVEIAPLTQASEVSVEPKWHTTMVAMPISRTVMGTNGLPVPRATATRGLSAAALSARSVFDERGFMKLGMLDSAGEPQFMLSDFRYDEAFMQLQNAAQADRNQRPDCSPGANLALLPEASLNETRSHDLVLHWSKRPDMAVAQRDSGGELLYLDDLVAGIRPQLGLVCQGNIRWFDLTARTVSYAVLPSTRSALDLARDDGFVPLVSFDKRTKSAATVPELLCAWNGWGIGLPLPSRASPLTSPFGKREIALPRSLPPFRFGEQVCMAARLVLRDGSSPQSAARAIAAYGTTWAGRAPSLIVGARDGDTPTPFRLLRWERLKAPVILLDGPMPAAQWWPAESSTNIVVATAFNRARGAKRRSRRYIACDKEPDMFATWKHGMFDAKVEPDCSAFGNIAMDDTANFLPAQSGGGLEAAFQRISLFGGKRAIPYHPDPLVTHIKIYAARRTFAHSREWVAVCDDNGAPICATFALYADSHWPHAREIKLDVHASPRHAHPLFVSHHAKSELDVHLPEGEAMVLVIAPLGDEQVLAVKHGFGKARQRQILSKFFDLRSDDGRQLAATIGALDPGQMPFLANVSMIDIQHALDRPAWVPKLDARMPAVRAADQTSQAFLAGIEFDPSSTAAIEIYGSWEEQEGSITRLLNAHRDGRAGREVHSFARIAARFEHRELGNETPDPTPRKNTVVRHPISKDVPFAYDFQDLKYRKIVFWPRGISSVSPQVDERRVCGAGEDFAWPPVADGHRAALAQAKVLHILASRKPKPPCLMYILPSFEFRTKKSGDTIRRTRSSLLAVHLACDWFDSGNGEKLALVLLRPGTGIGSAFDDIREKFGTVASFWGADPTKQGQSSLSKLPDYMELRHLEGMSSHIDYALPLPDGSSETLTLVLYEPRFCAEARSWRVEIPVLNPSAVSRPFVRFAFCRYQQYALAGLNVSDVVVADYAQLSDQREALIIRDPANKAAVNLTVYGISYEGAENSAQPRMSGWVERRCARQEDHREAAWVAENVPVTLVRSVREGRACWHGELSAAQTSGGDRYRIAIVEEERYRRDGDGDGAIPVYFDLVPLGD